MGASVVLGGPESSEVIGITHFYAAVDKYLKKKPVGIFKPVSCPNPHPI
jgi:hypothetical protein